MNLIVVGCMKQQEDEILINNSNNNEPTPDSNRGSSDVIKEEADTLMVCLDGGFNNAGTRA